MKKTYLLLLSLTVLMFSNCKKDEPAGGGDDNGNTEKKPVPTEVKTFNSSGSLASTDVYEYDGRLITKKTNTAGSEVTVYDYYYGDRTKGLLDSIVAKKNNVFEGVTIYTISNDLISRMEEYDANRGLIQRQDFTHYTNGKPDQFRFLIRDATYGDINIVGTMSYTGDNATSINFTGSISGITFNETITNTYDTKHTPFLNVTSVFEPIIAVNNVLNLVTDMSSAMGNQHQVNDFTYTYNSDDYPTRSDISQDGQAQGHIEYTYEDK